MSTTSKAIGDLQAQIDELQLNLAEVNEMLRESQQNGVILRRRNETLVEQLSNTKHEAEMNEALLKRKERRVQDLEDQLTEALSRSDKLQFEADTGKKLLCSAQERETQAVAECEQSRASYDALTAAYHEYKLMTNRRVASLEERLAEFVRERQHTLKENIHLLKTQEPEMMASYRVVVKNTQRLEEMYEQKNQAARNAISKLVSATKEHGQKTGIVMEECEDVLRKLNRLDCLGSRLNAAAGTEENKENRTDLCTGKELDTDEGDSANTSIESLVPSEKELDPEYGTRKKAKRHRRHRGRKPKQEKALKPTN